MISSQYPWCSLQFLHNTQQRRREVTGVLCTQQRVTHLHPPLVQLYLARAAPTRHCCSQLGSEGPLPRASAQRPGLRARRPPPHLRSLTTISIHLPGLASLLRCMAAAGASAAAEAAEMPAAEKGVATPPRGLCAPEEAERAE